MSCKLLQENMIRKSMEDFTEVRVDRLHPQSCPHPIPTRIIKRDQAGQAGPVFLKPFWFGLILWLSFTCCMMALIMICSIIFPVTKVRPQAYNSLDLPSVHSCRWVSPWLAYSHLGPLCLTRTYAKWWRVAWSTLLTTSSVPSGESYPAGPTDLWVS